MGWPVIAVLMIGLGGWLGYHVFFSGKSTTTSTKTFPWGAPGIPVVYAGKARQADVPVYLHALGTVKANALATITSRVSGTLEKVFFQEGQYVKQGQLLAKIDDRSYVATLKEARGQLAQNQALLTNAKLTLTRYKNLYAKDSLSKQDLQAQIAKVGQYQGMIASNKAQVDAARVNIDYTRLKAPMSGYVGLRLTDPGNLVSSNNTEIVRITQTKPIAVTFSIPQADLNQVLPGLRAKQSFAVTAYDQGGQKVLAQGKLKFISNQIDSDTGTVKLKALFANTHDQLYPQQFVNIRLQVATLKQAVVIPRSALQLGDQGDFVFRIDDKNKVYKQMVTAGPRVGDEGVVIKKGIQVGQQVVTTGVDNLTQGSQVKIIQPNKGHS